MESRVTCRRKAIPAGVAVLVALVASRADPVALATGYLAVQLDAGQAVLAGWLPSVGAQDAVGDQEHLRGTIPG